MMPSLDNGRVKGKEKASAVVPEERRGPWARTVAGRGEWEVNVK